MGLCLLRLHLRQNLERFRSKAAPQGPLWGRSGSRFLAQHRDGSPGTPRQSFEQSLEQSLEPLPLAKSLSQCELWSAAQETRGIFWDWSFSPAAFLLLPPAAASLVLIFLLSLSLHVSPLEVRCSSLFPCCGHIPVSKSRRRMAVWTILPRPLKAIKTLG